MAILYSPDGQSVQALGSYIQDFLRQGYSPNPPNQSQSIVSPMIALVGSMDINTASIKDLQSLPQVGVAIAKKIVAARPYKDLPDLINKISEVAWMDLRNQITLSQPVENQDEQTES